MFIYECFIIYIKTDLNKYWNEINVSVLKQEQQYILYNIHF